MLDLPEGKHVLKGGGKFYENGILSVDTKSIDLKNPFVDMPLSPKSNYPFPKGITILKGKVTDPENKPISQALITVAAMNQNALSEDDGGYFIHFSSLDTDATVTLDITKDKYKPAEQKALLKKGATTRASTTILTKV